MADEFGAGNNYHVDTGYRAQKKGRPVLRFLIEAALVTYAVVCLWTAFKVEHRYNLVRDQSYQVLQEAAVQDKTPDEAIAQLYETLAALGAPVEKGAIVVTKSGVRWNASFEYQDHMRFPGYSFPRNYSIAHEWTVF